VKARYFLVPLFALVLSSAPHLLFGPAMVDDAYITFRYAENIAAGKGFVFNSQDGPIQGTSTPLFTLLLAAARIVRIPCPTSAILLSIIGAALAYTFGLLLLAKSLPDTYSSSLPAYSPHPSPVSLCAGASWALALAVLPQWVIIQISGMETMFFVGLAITALWAVTARRSFLAAIAASLAVLTRYDGWALAILVFAALAWEQVRVGAAGKDQTAAGGTPRFSVRNPEHSVRSAIRLGTLLLALAAFVTLQIPWVIYTLHAFGSYVPQSVLTKRVVHTQSFLSGLQTHALYFLGAQSSLTAYFGIWAHSRFVPLLLLGIGFLTVLRPRAILVPLWGVASVIGFSSSGMGLFEWYFMPALAAYTWTAVWGLWAACIVLAAAWRRRHPLQTPLFSRAVAWCLPSLVVLWIVLGCLGALLPQRDKWPRIFSVQEATYLQAAQWVRTRAARDESVLVGEVGALAWALPDLRVVDSSGINSRAVYEARLTEHKQSSEKGADAFSIEGSARWVWLILREQPEWIVSIPRYVHLAELAQKPEFQRLYRLVHTVENPPAQPVLIYRFQPRQRP
jgi:hypothetical protein